ncbi:Abi family protein [Olivibacter ginsenosidimutans]
MLYNDFENILSQPRIIRYLNACDGNSRKAMTLYRKNLRLSQELFTVISCFEIALRNRINQVYSTAYGYDWLRDSSVAGGIFDNTNCRHTKNIILLSMRRLLPHYSPAKLLAEMDFGFWRYLFAQPQFHAGGKILLKIFPAKPTTTPAIQYNHSYVFNQLGKINELRNRIAHHEPICFLSGKAIIEHTS